MAKNNLRHMSRRELLKLLIEVTEENDRLREEIQRLERQSAYPALRIENPESMDEIVSHLTDLFQHARQTCDVYIENTKRHCQDVQAQDSADLQQETEELIIPKEVRFFVEKTRTNDEELCVCQRICLEREMPKTEVEQSL